MLRLSDLSILAAELILLIVYFGAGSMKILHPLGFASAGFAAYAKSAFPIIAQTWWIAATQIPISVFFVFVGVWELAGAVHMLFRPRRGAVVLAAAVLGAELMTHTVPGSYVHPMCSTAPGPYCLVSEFAHLVLFSSAVLVYFKGEALPGIARRLAGGTQVRKIRKLK